MLSTKKPQVKRHIELPATPPDRQRQVRLSRQEQEELVERFHAGAFKKELARIYGVHVETVRAIIQRHERAAAERHVQGPGSECQPR